MNHNGQHYHQHIVQTNSVDNCSAPNDRIHSVKTGWPAEVDAYLTYLAVNRKVSASTQNQALNALVFLYSKALDKPLGEIRNIKHAKQPKKLPFVLTQIEIHALLKRLSTVHWLPVCLLYGSDLRLMECVRLRVKDIDFHHRSIIVRSGKGNKDHVVTLPDNLILPLMQHLESVQIIHQRDLHDGFGKVYLPFALQRKYLTEPQKWA